MPLLLTTQQVMEQSKEKRLHVLEGVNAELSNFSHMREEQVKLSQDERSKLNFLSFAIVGAVLGFSPESLQSLWVIIGLGVLLFNAFLFGFVADCIQRNNNIQNCQDAIDEVRAAAKPYFDAYDEMGAYLDAPNFREEIFQLKYDAVQDAFLQYLEWQKAREPRFANKARFAIGYWYFAIFAAGLVIASFGLVMLHGLQQLKTLPALQEEVSLQSLDSSSKPLVEEVMRDSKTTSVSTAASSEMSENVILQNATNE